jgi:hypothetical protein
MVIEKHEPVNLPDLGPQEVDWVWVLSRTVSWAREVADAAATEVGVVTRDAWLLG